MGDLIIGSGPAGVALTAALRARGRSVTVMDAGAWIPDDRAALRDAMAARTTWDWTEAERTAYCDPQRAAADGGHMRYGSRFAVADQDMIFADPPEWLGLRASHARGGLSNLWGSAILPNRSADMADWPIGAEALGAHYRAVTDGILPMAGQVDGLETLFPDLPMAGRAPLESSPQGSRLLARLARADLAGLGVTAGAARQAVAEGCQTCGLCLYGCPWRLIWSGAQAAEGWQADAGVTYRSGVRVLGFAETGNGVDVTLEGGEVINATRLFLATGVLESARILLASMPGLAALELADSAYQLMPMLHRWGAGGDPARTALHTLTQGFVEIDDPAISPRLVHSQLYTWNDFYLPEMLQSYGRLPFARALLGQLSKRLIVAQTFLHSDHSGRIRLTRANSGSADGRLAAEWLENPDTGPVMTAARSRLALAMRRAGVYALTPAAQLAGPGSGFHVGASMPMARAPRDGQSDTLGRPAGLNRVHVVDASVLPAIAATTITLTVMANAHRIGTEAP